MPSDAFGRFMDSLTRGIVRSEDLHQLDLDALREVTDPAEVDAAVEALDARLADGHDDPRVIDALATAGTPKALAALDRVAHGRSLVLARARAARRLWAMQGLADALDILRELAKVDVPLVAEEVLPALREIGSDDALDVAVDMLAASAVFDVRTMATNVVFVHYGFDEYDRIPMGAVWSLRLDLVSRFPSLRAHAVTTLRSWVDRRRMGESDDALGIVVERDALPPTLIALLGAAQNPQQPFDEAALAGLSGGAHGFAVDVVLGALERGEARAVKALEALGGERADLALADWRAGRVDPP